MEVACERVELELLSAQLKRLSDGLAILDEYGPDSRVVQTFEALNEIVKHLNYGRPNVPIGAGDFCHDVYSTIAPLVEILSRPLAPGSVEGLLEAWTTLAADSRHAQLLAKLHGDGSLQFADDFNKRRMDLISLKPAENGYADILHRFRDAHAVSGMRGFRLELMTRDALRKRRLDAPEDLLPGHRSVFALGETATGKQLFAVPVVFGPRFDSRGRAKTLLYLGANSAAREFDWLARLAGGHLPKTIRDAWGLKGFVLGHLWLECLLRFNSSTRGASSVSQPGELSAFPFRDSADLIEEWLGESKCEVPSVKKRVPPRAARDRWIYDEVQAGVPYKSILIRLARRNHDGGMGWPSIKTIEGIRKAAIKYAKENSLPELKPRQNRATAGRKDSTKFN